MGAVYGELKKVRVYAQAKRASDIADAELAAARNALVTLTNHPREQGAGVAMTRFWKTGNVEYKKVKVLQGLDLSSY